MDNMMASTSVAASSASSKRQRSLSPDVGPCKRRQVGNSRGSAHHVKPHQELQNDEATPPARRDGLIWAFKRQPLCDSQAYFRAHQGGTYTKGKVIHGMLVAGSVEIRDFLEKDTLVTCCGGGRTQTQDGSWVRLASTKAPGILESWKNAMAKQRPVLIIVANDHPAWKDLDLSSIPDRAQYVVLGSFFVTDIWQEMGVALPRTNKETAMSKTRSKKASAHLEYPIHKLKLQRVDVKKTPIYWKKIAGTVEEGQTLTPDPKYHCPICSVESPRVFDGKELCLNSMCKDFFHEGGRQLSASDKTLRYSKTFMNSTIPWHGDISEAPSGFQPPPLKDEIGWGSEKAFRMGMVCPDCGCCNSRAHWNFWNCINCGYIYRSEPRPYPLTEVAKENKEHNKKFLHRKQAQYQTFKVDQTTICLNEKFVSMFTNAMDKGRDSVITTYMIFNQNHQFLGSVVHERPSETMLQMPGGSNELFQESQESMEAMKMKRNPCRCVDSRIETLTRHFECNFGVIYEFGVSPDNTAFRDAPDIVLKSLAQLTYFGQRAVESSQHIFSAHQWEALEGSTIMEPWVAPNELLALGYMEDDSISYHDDGEDQLNGVISTLSLGSPAVMKLRLKGKKSRRGKKVGSLDDKPDADDESSGKGSNSPVLEIQLRHGDVVTMCDTRLQASTEHTVQPVGLRRFAMTSRFINTHYYDKGDPAEKLKKWNITHDDLRRLGELPSRAAQFSFKGIQLQPHASAQDNKEDQST